MSANVETMFYTRERPWHGLGKMVMEAPTSKEALALAGLDWQVIQKPIVTEDDIPIPGFKVNIRNIDEKKFWESLQIAIKWFKMRRLLLLQMSFLAKESPMKLQGVFRKGGVHGY